MSRSQQQTQANYLEQLQQELFGKKHKKPSGAVQGGGGKKKKSHNIQQQSIFPEDWTPQKIAQFVKRFPSPPPPQKKWTETKKYLERIEGLKGKKPSGARQRSAQQMYMLLNPEQYIVPTTIKKSRTPSYPIQAYPMEQLQQQKPMVPSRPLKKKDITQIYQI